MAPRRFNLVRDEDVSGISGTGIVAEGVLFSPTQAALDAVAGTGDAPERHVAMEWLTEWPTSVVFHQKGLAAVEHVHGHNGRTHIEWLDPEPPDIGDVMGGSDAG